MLTCSAFIGESFLGCELPVVSTAPFSCGPSECFTADADAQQVLISLPMLPVFRSGRSYPTDR